MDIVNERIQVDQLLRTSPAIAAKYGRASIRGGDVLLGIIRATKVAVVPPVLEGANITQGTARLRPSDMILPQYLAAVLRAPATQRWLHAHYRGIDMPGLNLADVRQTPIPVPSKTEQAEIVRRVEILFEYADRLEVRLATAESAVERLTPALLDKAFRGELLPQDPADEPASELLNRLHAHRQARQACGSTKRRRNARMATA
jgi:type I restriction enzyme S subunit